MTADEYLQELQDHLKIFSRQEQAALLEEIGSHIESGEEDARMGREKEQRLQKTIGEMGSPEQMGHGLRMVHRPEGWIDYLLVILPILINTFIVNAISVYTPTQSVAFSIGFGLMCLALVLVGIRRHTHLLIVTWISIFFSWALQFIVSTSGYLVPSATVNTAGHGYTITFISASSWQVTWFKDLTPLEAAFWLVMLAGGIYLLGWIIWHNRRDALIVSYAVVPLAVLLCSFLVPPLSYQLGWVRHIEGLGFSSQQSMMFLMSSPVVFGILAFVLLGVLFLASRRTVRWVALAAYVLFAGLQTGYFLYRPSLYALPQYLQSLILPMAIVFLGWWLDKKRKGAMMLSA